MSACPHEGGSKPASQRVALPGWLIGLQILLLTVRIARQKDVPQRIVGKRGSVVAGRAKAAELAGEGQARR
jgi:hypothetical protein